MREGGCLRRFYTQRFVGYSALSGGNALLPPRAAPGSMGAMKNDRRARQLARVKFVSLEIMGSDSIFSCDQGRHQKMESDPVSWRARLRALLYRAIGCLEAARP